MDKSNIIMREDDVKNLLKHVLSISNIKITPATFLTDIHKHLATGKEIIKGICNVLQTWGIESLYLPSDVELSDDLPTPSLLFLYENLTKKEGGYFVIMVDKDDSGITVIDLEQGKYYIEKLELQSIWSNIVIALDTEEALNEKDYELKIIAQRNKIEKAGGVSVIMSIYNQAAFVGRAIKSLQMQTYKKWELILINDGSTDDLQSIILPLLKDERIHYLSNNKNEGLGFSLNKGLDNASFDMIAYLPADDIYYKNHLQMLVETLVTTNTIMTYSGVLHHFNDMYLGNYGQKSFGIIEGFPLQLVQVLHHKTNLRWVERDELVTDDLNRMFWKKLLYNNRAIGTREITCEWVDHSMQRHKIINDRNGGGIYLYKQIYGVSKPIRFQSTVGNFIDEIKHFENFRKPLAIEVKHKGEGLKILLVGELAFNPERICALEERGHKLYGLWMKSPVNFNTVGPLPFGNVEDIALSNWEERVAEIKPDIIYALLNYHAVPLAYHVLINNKGIPFVWHFKEGPFYCRNFGTWRQLVDLYSLSDGQIYTNEMVHDWFRQFLGNTNNLPFILDGDLPKKEWFCDERSPLLSTKDDEIHTVVAGRPMGLFPEDIRQMALQKIHLHLYGNIFQNQFKEMIKYAIEIAPNYIHLHPNCPQKDWVKEFSQYDAGWLHFFKSENNGELMRADWHDLNFPARMATYAMAGLPMLMRDNSRHRVASQEFLEAEKMALTFSSFKSLKEVLYNKSLLTEVRENVWNKRHLFSFDEHVDELIIFFRKVIQKRKQSTLDNLIIKQQLNKVNVYGCGN